MGGRYFRSGHVSEKVVGVGGYFLAKSKSTMVLLEQLFFLVKIIYLLKIMQDTQIQSFLLLLLPQIMPYNPYNTVSNQCVL